MTRIFDPDKIKDNHQHAARSDGDFFLHELAADHLHNRLHDIKRDFHAPVLLSHYCPRSFHSFPCVDICDDRLGLAVESHDLIISLMQLHKLNDLPGFLVQIRQALRPDGVFLFAIPGADSLGALRESFMRMETNHSGGAAARFHPLISLQQMAGLMQRTGFALPVVDEQKLKLSYSGIIPMLRDIRNMGEGLALYGYQAKPLSHRVIQMVETQHKKKTDNRIDIPVQMIYGIGWSPHESQQKPARRGSAQHSLSDAL